VVSSLPPSDGKRPSLCACGGLLVGGEAAAPWATPPAPPEEPLLGETPGDALSGGDPGPAGVPGREARPGLPAGVLSPSCPKL
jgi:hypothetical protein